MSSQASRRPFACLVHSGTRLQWQAAPSMQKGGRIKVRRPSSSSSFSCPPSLLLSVACVLRPPLSPSHKPARPKAAGRTDQPIEKGHGPGTGRRGPGHQQQSGQVAGAGARRWRGGQVGRRVQTRTHPTPRLAALRVVGRRRIRLTATATARLGLAAAGRRPRAVTIESRPTSYYASG